MKNIILFLFVGIMFSCGSSGQKNNQADAKANKENIGKTNFKNAEVGGYSFSVAGKKLSEKVVPYGATLLLSLKGCDGFKENNGKVMCDASIEVLSLKNERVILLDKLFEKSYPAGMPVEIYKGTVELELTCQTPIKLNETYKIVFKLKDKQSDAVISVEDNFAMNALPGMTYAESGLTSDGFMFFKNSEHEVVTENVFSVGDTIYALATGLRGLLADESGMVRPDASMHLYTENGDEIDRVMELYKEYKESGVDPVLVSQQVYLQVPLPATLKSGSNYYIKYLIGDYKSKACINLRYDFRVK